MGHGRSSRKRGSANRSGGGRVIDTTGELPVTLGRAPRPRRRDDDEEFDLRSVTSYGPRVRVTARPLRRPLDSTPLAALQSEWEGSVAPVAVKPRPVISTEYLRKKLPRAKTLVVYLALIVVVSQTLVSALTPLGRSERQAIGDALTAIGAAPAISTPFPAGPTPYPVSTPAAFIRTMLPYAQQAHRDLGWPVSMVLAQMGVEHGWSFPDFDGWNLANSKAFPDPNGDGGVCYRQSVVRGFCYAKTPQIGLAIYEHVAHLTYYRSIAAAARTGGAAAAARAMGASPWDEGHYALNGVPGGKLLAAMSAYNLYQYDS